MSNFKKDSLPQIAKEIRRKVVWMSYNSKVGHLGSALSIVDILVSLYFEILNITPRLPKDPKRDRFILSKGHAASALYAVLARLQYFPQSWLDLYCKDNGRLGTHPDHFNVPGIEWTTGSLGHGLSVGCGMALALKMNKSKARVFVLISDAESQEGEIWEAALAAGQHHLDNLYVVVDYNQVQAFGIVKQILNLEPFAKKWSTFGWKVVETAGHDISKLVKAFSNLESIKGKPKIVIAHTVRGKGVSFMEGAMKWYYHYPQFTDYQKALTELS